MAEVDELEINPFFIALQNKFVKEYEKAQESCCLLCIPQSDCLLGATITKKFVDTHILKPSRFFKSKYITQQSDQQLVYVDDNGDYVFTEEGFPTKVKISILGEELGYNKAYKPYKILIIERPLDNNTLKKNKLEETTYSGEFKQKYTTTECRDFLKSFPELSKPFQELNEQIHQFNTNYVLLPDYLDEAGERLHTMCMSTAEKCMHSCPSKSMVSHKFKDTVAASVEVYTIGCVMDKLYPVICSHCGEEDTAMVEKCRKLAGLTPDLLGVPESLCFPLPAAVVELANLDRMCTPVEKMFCLKNTLDSITAEINSGIRVNHDPSSPAEDLPVLTPDDLIPILVTVIVQAKCRHIHSDVYYMENFYWSAGAKDRDTLSYCLVTFKAAVQYMVTTDFSHINLEQNVMENEMRFKNLMKNLQGGMSSEKSIKQSQENGQPRTQVKCRFDRQMENISKMLEETTTNQKEAKQKPKEVVVQSVFGNVVKVPSPNPDSKVKDQEKKADLGDFLSSLQDDMFLSFGKQT